MAVCYPPGGGQVVKLLGYPGLPNLPGKFF